MKTRAHFRLFAQGRRLSGVGRKAWPTSVDHRDASSLWAHPIQGAASLSDSRRPFPLSAIAA